MELKKVKNVLCLIVVGLLDLRVMSAERRGMFGELRLSRCLQSGEEESQCRWCVVLSFASLSLSLSLSPSLSLSQSWSYGLRVSFPFFHLAPLSRNLSFISFFSSDRIKLSFLCLLLQRTRIGRKITFNYFYFWQISSTFRYALILCAEPPFFHFKESLSTDNIRWMLSDVIGAETKELSGSKTSATYG